MALNLVSIVEHFITPETIARIATTLGIDRVIAQKATDAAIPALLACMSNVAIKPGGTQQFNNALEQLPNRDPSELSSAVGASGPSSLGTNGSGILSGLLGKGTQQSLGAAIGKFAGIGENKGTSLLGMLAPMALGALSRESPGTGAGGLVSMLADQRDELAKAIPSGLASQMKTGGLADAVGGSLRAPAAAASGRARPPEKSHSIWPYALATAVVILTVGIFYFNREEDQRIAELGDVDSDIADIVTGGIDVPEAVSSSLANLNATLDGIYDAGSARSALPSLEEVSTEMGRIGNMAGNLPESTRAELAQIVATEMPIFDRKVSQALSQPGVESVAGPVIKDLQDQITALGGQTYLPQAD